MAETKTEGIRIVHKEWNKISRKRKQALYKGILDILSSANSNRTVPKATLAYKYIAQEIDIYSIVRIRGVDPEEESRIKKVVLDHETENPRLSITGFIDRLSSSSLSPYAGIDNLLENIHGSVLTRFMLYQNVYNEEVSRKKKQLYNYVKILEKVWEFHKETRRMLCLLAYLQHRLKALIKTPCSTAQGFTENEILEYFSDKEMKTEIQRIYYRTEAQEGESNGLEREYALVKGILKYFLVLSYNRYYIHGYGEKDLLFLYYNAFNICKYNTKTIDDSINSLNRCICMHVRGFYSAKKKIRKRSMSPERKKERINEIRQLKKVFINSDYSRLEYFFIPRAHSFLFLSVVLVSSVYLSDLLTSLFYSKCFFYSSSSFSWHKVLSGFILGYGILCGVYTDKTHREGYLNEGMLGEIEKGIKKALLSVLRLILLVLLTDLLLLFYPSYIIYFSLTSLALLMVSLVFVLCDSLIRHEYAFCFSKGGRMNITFAYAAALLLLISIIFIRIPGISRLL